jgi:hypothetical protein
MHSKSLPTLLLLGLAACHTPQENTYKAPASSSTGTPVATTTSTSTPTPPPGPLCDPKTVWATPGAVDGMSDDAAIFGSITPDELTMAWMTKDGAIHWADRAKTSDPFGASNEVQGDFAVDRVALSADGLRIVATSANRRTFGQITRTSRTAVFDNALDKHPFAGLNASVKERNKTGQLGDIVMSADERTLVFSYWAVVDSTIRISHRASKTDAWGVGVPVAQSGLEPIKGARRRPTGTSTDNRTIFFWDEANGTQLMAQRDGEEAMVFTQIIDIGLRPLAVPNADCTVLVHAAGVDMAMGGKGIASSKRM